MLLISFGLSVQVALADSIVTNALVGLTCGFVSNNLKYYLPKKERYWYILFISLGLSALILLICKAILVPALGHLAGAAYGIFFSRSWPVRYDIVFLQIGCMTILSV